MDIIRQMPELNDHELLAEFARTESEPAFAALAARHVNLVYSTARRFTGNPDSAEEITQAVFIILARKAAQLSPRTVLSGWLYQTARLTAANFVKGEIRRQRREQEAYMQSTLSEPGAAAWEQIAPLLDEAMGRLGETDRNAVVLRFFENKTAAEVGAALKLTEAAAHMRVNRALEKLRTFFTKRGVTLTVAIVAGAVSANSVQAAPTGLVAAVAATAAKGAAVSATLTILVKGTMQTITWLEHKFAIGVGVAALLAGGVVTVAISQTGGEDKPTAQEIINQAQNAYAALTNYSDSGKVTYVASTYTATFDGKNGKSAVPQNGGKGPDQLVTNTFNIRLQRPNFYRIDWTEFTGSGGSPGKKGFMLFSRKGVIWSDGTGDFRVVWSDVKGDFPVVGPDGLEKDAKLEKMKDMQEALKPARGRLLPQAASTIPEIFFNQNGSNVLQAAGQILQRQTDKTVNGVDCYVVSSSIELAGSGNNANQAGRITTTLWIGKQDHFIHQTQTQIMPQSMVFTQTYENISVNQQFSSSDFDR